MNEETLTKKIVKTLQSRTGKKFRRRELYSLIKEKDLDYREFKNILSHMEKNGTIVRSKGRKISLPAAIETMTGIFTASRNGGGYVRFPDGESVIVRKVNVDEALTGDTVQVSVKRQKQNGYSGTAKIVRVVERSAAPVIGIYRKHGSTEYIVPEGDGYPRNLLVKKGGTHDARDGDLVMCKLVESSIGFSAPMCTIVEILGEPDTPGVDVLAITKRYGLPIDFSEDVIAESEHIPDTIGQDVLAERRDIRKHVTFTVDPDDARDFDDAISINRTGDGGYELGVHIADVSWYVAFESAMDTEALARGMSCYLVDRVIPMLPERLSNGLCSLNENVDRLTKSVFARLDGKGNLIGAEFANTVINSNMRLTYRQVQLYLDGDRSNGAGRITSGVGEALGILSDLTDVLIERRTERGAIDMELPEAKVILDERGKPSNIVKRDRIKANRMIEEAMLLANTAVANKLADTAAMVLYRIHDKPDTERIRTFGETAQALGYDFNIKKGTSREYIQQFLLSIQNTPGARVLNTLLLHSMKKAAYSPKNIGHFGLALNEYAHFTSPIRRYPDLVVHRQLDSYVLGNGNGNGENSLPYYENLGIHVTQREIISDSAERDSIKMKTAEFMQNHLGEDFEGSITGIMPNGFFVELDDFFVEGLVHVNSLEDDYYTIDSTGISMSGKRSGRSFTIGDRLRITVASADKQRGEVDFMVLEKHKSAGKSKKKKKKKKDLKLQKHR